MKEFILGSTYYYESVRFEQLQLGKACGLEKGSEFLMNGLCCERLGERGFQYKACRPKIPDIQAKRFREMWRKQWLQIRNDSKSE